MKFCVAMKRRVFSPEDKSLDPKSKILIYASLSKIGNVAGCDQIHCHDFMSSLLIADRLGRGP